MTEAVIVAGSRTPFGKLMGGLSTLSAVDLGAHAISHALDRAQVGSNLVDSVIMGQVLQAGCGQGPARQAAVQAGIPMNVPSITINKLCLSGISAIMQAAMYVRTGEYDIVVAGGQESMTNAPHLLPHARAGYKYGNVTVTDHMDFDGLYDPFTDQAMGGLTEAHNVAGQEFDRHAQDAFAAQSHERAARAQATGKFADEISPVTITSRKGDTVISADEGVRAEASVESLAKLRPVFNSAGVITAGNASPVSDGAAAIVVASRAKAEELGLPILAVIGAQGVVAGPDSSLQLQPAHAIQAAADKAGVAADSFDLYEINEAFAAVGLSSMKDLGVDDERVNVNGGAIAIGHPIGASGTRIVLDMALELQRRGGQRAVAALCGGGGQGDALILERP